MPAKAIITASLTPELTADIASKVQSGHYRSASEVVRAALRLLIEADERSRRGTAPSDRTATHDAR